MNGYVCLLLISILLIALLTSGYTIYRLREQMRRHEVQLKKMEEIASIDGLTLVYNRHMLDNLLRTQVAIAERYHQFFSVVFFDIDDFKVINDRYGHDAGDEVLIGLSSLVMRSLRQSDIFGRWGGDEFLIILPETIQKQAARLVELLEKRIDQYMFPKARNVSCTFGIASYEVGDTPQTILKRADERLYALKMERKTAQKKRI